MFLSSVLATLRKERKEKDKDKGGRDSLGGVQSVKGSRPTAGIQSRRGTKVGAGRATKSNSIFPGVSSSRKKSVVPGGGTATHNNNSSTAGAQARRNAGGRGSGSADGKPVDDGKGGGKEDGGGDGTNEKKAGSNKYNDGMPHDIKLAELDKAQVVFLFFDDPSSSPAAQAMSVFIMLCILLSCTTFVLESLPQYRKPNADVDESDALYIFWVIEVFAMVVFTIEYVARVTTVHRLPKPLDLRDNKHANFWMTWRFVKEPLNVVDLVAILPFYIEVLFASGGSSLTIFRVLRLARIFRVFKLSKVRRATPFRVVSGVILLL
jgi:hypothetical protein